MKIRRPDDMHVHLRDGYMLRHMAQLSARHFARALVMPNTTEPIRNGLDVEAYRAEIKAAAPTLEPLMDDQALGPDDRGGHPLRPSCRRRRRQALPGRRDDEFG